MSQWKSVENTKLLNEWFKQLILTWTKEWRYYRVNRETGAFKDKMDKRIDNELFHYIKKGNLIHTIYLHCAI